MIPANLNDHKTRQGELALGMDQLLYDLHVGDAGAVLETLGAESVDCCITSPPYFGLRDYGVAGQLGLEGSIEQYIAAMVDVFRGVRRVLRSDGTLWLNLGDSYGANKNLLGIPWRVALALQADGWYLRQDIIWHKPNPMPESTCDRCTKAHEYLFLLSKSPAYYYDAVAIREPATSGARGSKFHTGKTMIHQGNKASKKPRLTEGGGVPSGWQTGPGKHGAFHDDGRALVKKYGYEATGTRNKRSVWTISTKPYKGAHFATFPPDLVEPCVLAGCPPGGVVLDPFAGTGTVAGVALAHARRAVLIELNPASAALVEQRVLEVKQKCEVAHKMR